MTPEPQRHSIAIDIGNSRIKFGLLTSPEIENGFPVLLDSFAVRHDELVPWQLVHEWSDKAALRTGDLTIASVNPSALKHLLSQWPKGSLGSPEVIDNPGQLPLRIEVDDPRNVGIDRLLNAVAANRLRQRDQAMIVVGSGTAGTVDLVTPSGAFAGGAILSGLEMTARSLHGYTALLPLLSVEELRTDPPNPLGKNTRDAMHSGIFWGHVGALGELIRRLGEGFSSPPGLIVTGGAARMLTPYLSDAARHIPHLVLYGLAILLEHRDVEKRRTRDDSLA